MYLYDVNPFKWVWTGAAGHAQGNYHITVISSLH